MSSRLLGAVAGSAGLHQFTCAADTSSISQYTDDSKSAGATALTGQIDAAALTPLIWEHVNPYGRFDLDKNAQLALL